MSIEQWAGLIVSILSIGASFGLIVRWLVKHYFDEMKAELKPNSGSSMKDQVTRLEAKQEKLESKIDDLYDKFIEYLATEPKRTTRNKKD
jgi:hypothetical protein